VAVVLVVDDEKIIRKMVGMHLEDAGHEVFTAENAREGLRILNEKPLDVVVADIIMPRMSGIELLLAIRKESPHVQVIMIAGAPTVQNAGEAVREGAFDFLTKPFTGDEICKVVEKAAQLKAVDDERRRLHEHLEELVEERTAALRESEARNRAFVEAIPDQMYRIHREGIILDFKARNTQDLLIQSEEPGNKLSNIMPAELVEHWVDYIGKTLDSGRVQFFEYQLALPHGVQDFEARFAVSGEDQVLAIVRNITERKQTKHLIDYLVHDMNGRNQVIIAALEEMLQAREDSSMEEQLEFLLSQMSDNTGAITKVYKLMNSAERQFVLVPTDPIAAIRKAVNRVKITHPGKKIEINQHIIGTISYVMADEFLEDVFELVLDNALKHAETQVDIIAGVDSTDPTMLEIKIEDNGPGIPDDLLKQGVFHRFRKKKGGGMGLGLYIVKSTVERYAGEVQLFDRVKGDHTQGCSFVIKIPACP